MSARSVGLDEGGAARNLWGDTPVTPAHRDGPIDSRLIATPFDIGVRYERPPAEPLSWFHDVLEQIRGERDGGIPIRVEASTGHRVDALLVEGNPAIAPGPHGKVSLDSHGEDLVIASEMIAAFTLLPGKSVEREDELRG